MLSAGGLSTVRGAPGTVAPLLRGLEGGRWGRTGTGTDCSWGACLAEGACSKGPGLASRDGCGDGHESSLGLFSSSVRW